MKRWLADLILGKRCPYHRGPIEGYDKQLDHRYRRPYTYNTAITDAILGVPAGTPEDRYYCPKCGGFLGYMRRAA